MPDRLAAADLPLTGLTVLDFSQFLAGPSATLRLADLGATVYKIERPGAGELGRGLGIGGVVVDGDSLAFHTSNRNKQSIALDLKDPDGQARARALVAAADVLVENFRPGVMERLGLDYDAARRLNPRIVYGRVTGYGDDGPWRDLPGQDLLVQAVSGLPWLNGTEADPPTPFGLSIVDTLAGQHLAQGLLAALVRRERAGRGALVEASLLESALDLQAEVLTSFLNGGPERPPRSQLAAAHPYVAAPYGVYRTKDGWLALAMGDVPRLGRLLDLPELEVHTDPTSWFAARDEIKEAVARRVAPDETRTLLEKLVPAGVWAAEVLTWEQLFAHDATRALDVVMRVTRPDGPTLRVTRSPIRIDRGALGTGKAAPRLDEHGDLPA